MTITCEKYLLKIDTEENQVPVLVIENPAIYSDFTGSLFRQCSGDEGDIIISEHGTILPASNVAMTVSDYFSLNFSSRQIQARLYQQLRGAGGELEMQRSLFTGQGVALLEELLSLTRFDHVAYDLDPDWNDIFKMYGVRVEEDYLTLPEKMISFLRVCSELLNVKLLALINLKAYLPEEDLLEFYQMASYLKIDLLLIESAERLALPMEKYFIIDKDDCLIIK